MTPQGTRRGIGRGRGDLEKGNIIMYKVEKVGIPKNRPNESKYPWSEMKSAGDGFFVSDTDRTKLSSAASTASKRHGFKISVINSERDGVRGGFWWSGAINQTLARLNPRNI